MNKQTPPTELLSPKAITSLRNLLVEETKGNSKIAKMSDEDISFVGRFFLEVFIQGLHTRNAMDTGKATICPPFSETEPQYAVLVPEKLRAAREMRGLSQIAVAGAIGHKSNNRISRWEKGKALPDKENLQKLEAFFKVSLC